MLNNMFLYDNSSGTDPNVVQASQAASGAGNIGKIQGNICQAYSTGGNAAWFYLNTSAWNALSATSLSLLNNIVLGNISGVSGCGSLFNCATANDGNTSVTIEHNTFNTDGSAYVGAVYLGDGNTTVAAGMLASLRGNLGYGTATPAGSYNAILRIVSNAVATNVCAAANCEYNGGVYLVASSSPYAQTSKPGYVTSGTQNIFSSAPGSNSSDVSSTTSSTDPLFFDSTRNMSTAYSASSCLNQTNISTAGNFQALTEYIASTMNGNPTVIADVVTWIKAGYAPRNSAYKTTWGTDTNTVNNTTIGAVAGIFGGPWPYHLDNQNMSSFAAGMGL
jgi:hypothetical protein